MQDVRIDGVDALWAGWRHEGAAAELVRALKYGRVTAAVTPIADRMALVAEGAHAADLVTWVPCSPARRADRGFDPAELLARAVARRLGLRARRTLRRLDDRPQTARSLAGRLDGPELVVRPGLVRAARRQAADGRLDGPEPMVRHRPSRAAVLVIDDVCTTGSTLRAAAAALRAGGATAVAAAVATVAPAAPRQPVALPLR